MYIKVILTLLVIATAAVAILLARSRPAQVQSAPLIFHAEVALSQELGAVHFENVTVEQALGELESRTGIRIVVDWNRLAAAKRSINPNTKINITRGTGTLENVLDPIFVPGRTGGTSPQITYNTIGGVLTVSIDNAIPIGARSLRIYDIGDLVSDEYWGWKPPPGEAATTRETRISSLAWLISESVSGKSVSWQRTYFYSTYTADGPEITAVGSRLMILQTTEKHREIETLLAWLRRGGR